MYFHLLCSESFGQHLHAFVVADTNDQKIGNSVATDAANLTALLEEGMEVGSLTLHQISGDAVTSKNIVQSIQNAGIAPQDSVLFYYSGHAAFDKNSENHYFTLQGRDRLKRLDVRNAISRYSPKLTVLLTDCCASVVPLEEDFGAGAGVAGMGVRSSGYPLMRELFFNTRGLIDITSSRPGQYSVGRVDGGIFTNALIKTIEDNSHTTLNWYDIFVKSRSEASANFEAEDGDYRAKHNKGIADDQGTQTAWTFETMYGHNPNDHRMGMSMDLNQAGLITQVIPGSVAQLAGLETGDRILSVNGETIATTTEAIKLVTNSSSKISVVVQCVRTGNHYKFTLKLPY